MRRAALLFALGACAAVIPPPPVPPLPSQGGPAWLAVESDHFVVWTDADDADARRLLVAMERLREVIYGTSVFGAAPSSARTFVIAMRNAEEVGEYLPAQFTAYATGGGPLFQPLVLLNVRDLDKNPSIVAHELTHAISFGIIPNQPRWFAEGLAGYYETVKLTGDAKVAVGIPLAGRAATLRRGRPLPMKSVFACTEHACMDDRFYATVWVLFSYFVVEHPRELLAYMLELYRTPEGDTSGLFAKAFPMFADLATLDRALAEWIARDKMLVNEYRVAATAPSLGATKALSDVDALVARGLARYTWKPTAMPAELTDALAKDPTNLYARLVETIQQQGNSVEVARAVAAAHPDDWRALWLLGFALFHAQGDPAEMRTARDSLCALVATDARGAVVPATLCR